MQLILDKGQEDDWFGSTRIRWAFAIFVVGFVVFLIVQLTKRNPIVDLTVFKDRNFAMGCLFISLLGAVIYGIVSILPLFYQTLMGYTAMAAGIAVSPRGIGAVLIMPLVGVLTSRMDNRWLIAAGFGLFAFASLAMSGLTLDISRWSLLWPVILSGSAAGMVFVPLSTTAVATLSNQRIGNASGLYNLLRNIGGSVGIAITNTIIARHEQIHRDELSRYISRTVPFDRGLAVLRSVMSAHAGPRLSDHRAYALIQNGLDQQAAVYSYVDVFHYFTLVCFVCAPLVFLVRRARAKQGAVSGAH